MVSEENGDWIGNKHCIGSEVEGKKDCKSSDANGCYEHTDDDGNVWYDSYCRSCNQVFTKSEVHGSSLASELGIDVESGEVTERIHFEKQPKKEPITSKEALALIKEVGYKANNYRGVRDDINKFFGHLTKLDSDGKVLSRYYPETSKYSIKGYKCRNHPKNFRYGNIGSTGSHSDLSGMSKFKSGGRTILVVGGEEDKAAAYQMLLDYYKGRDQEHFVPAVISPTTGEGSAPNQLKRHYEYLDQFENIILGFDHDDAGKEAAKNSAKVLPKGKVKIATWSGGDPNAMLQKKQSKLFISNYFEAKDLISSGIIRSGDIMGLVKEELIKPRISLPPYMKMLQENTRGGLLQGRIINLIGDTSVGKCLGIDTPVLMADNSIKNVQDVIVGDLLMGDDGSPRKVLTTTKGGSKLYKIKQVCGMDYVVNSDHVLSLRAGYDCKNSDVLKGDIVNLGVEDYIKEGSKLKRSLKGYKADMTKFGEGNKAKHPWLLGLWLADGAKDSARITMNVNDHDILNKLKEECLEHGYGLNHVVSKGNAITFSLVNGFRTFLRLQGLLGNKHVPKEYLNSCYEDRINLLSGLLDGDGYLYGSCYEITQKSDDVTNGVLSLCRSLCLKVSNKLVSKSCQGGFTGEYHRMVISGRTDRLNLVLDRKKVINKSNLRLKDNTAVTVEDIGDGEYYGFSVDGNHLFCLGDGTVTHNSTHVNGMEYHWIFNSPVKTGVVSLEATAGQYGIDILSMHLQKNLSWESDGNKILEYLETDEVKEQYDNLWKDEYGEDRFCILDERDGDIKALERQMETLNKKHGCDLLIIDVASDVLHGLSLDEQANHMKFQKNIIKTGVTIINVLHTRKPPNSRDGLPQKASEYDALGSGSMVQSGAINIVINRNKMAKCPIERNTTYVDMPKCRGGTTGEAGQWFYDVETRKVYDRKDYFDEHPDKLPEGYDLSISSYDKEWYKEGGNCELYDIKPKPTIKKVVPKRV